MGMGGTDLIMFGDVGGAAFNPASVGGAGTYSESQSAVGRTSNVHVAKINDLSNGLKHLGDQFNNSNGSLASVRDSFQKVYNFATDAGAKRPGPARRPPSAPRSRRSSASRSEERRHRRLRHFSGARGPPARRRPHCGPYRVRPGRSSPATAPWASPTFPSPSACPSALARWASPRASPRPRSPRRDF